MDFVGLPIRMEAMTSRNTKQDSPNRQGGTRCFNGKGSPQVDPCDFNKPKQEPLVRSYTTAGQPRRRTEKEESLSMLSDVLLGKRHQRHRSNKQVSRYSIGHSMEELIHRYDEITLENVATALLQ